MKEPMCQILVFLAIDCFIATSAFAGSSKHDDDAQISGAGTTTEEEIGCDRTIAGSFIYVGPSIDVLGNGTFHRAALQLTLNSDGTATRYFTGGLDFPLSGGISESEFGSWKCRDDGKLVIVLIGEDYLPTTATNGHAPLDLALAGYWRSTSLFSVTSRSVITMIESRLRTYGPNDDPSDPAGGVLGALKTKVNIYARVIATDSDLMAP